MIHVVGLHRTFAGVVALKDVSLSLAPGEVVGLLGPNGAGKTTLMRILAGYLPPSAGTVHIAHLDLLRQGLAARAQLGYLPEQVPLYPELRVEEQLRFFAGLRRLRGASRREALNRVVERCGLADVRRWLVGQLSKGFRQRLGLATALLGEPPILILDEPTSGLDPQQAHAMRQLIRSLAPQRTILISTHLLVEAEQLCDTVLILHGGRLKAQGTLDTLRRGAGELVIQVRGPAEGVGTLLEQIPGIEQVEIHRQDSVLCCVARGELSVQIREEVAKALQGAGWALQELHYRQPDLTEIFAQLTGTNDEAALEDKV